jgi:hypothetical protein
MTRMILRHQTFLLPIVPIAFLAASGFFLAVAHAPQAGIDNTLSMPSNDGYGLSDCAAEGRPCGKL